METIIIRGGITTRSYAHQEIALAEYRELVSATKKMQACSSSDSLSENLVEETYVSYAEFGIRATLCHTKIKKVTILPPSRLIARSSNMLSNNGHVHAFVLLC